MKDFNSKNMEGRASRPAPRSRMARYAKPAHKKAAKALGYALTLDSRDAWFAASVVWQARLTPQEAATAACAALRAAGPDFVHLVATEAPGDAGTPLAPFGDIMDDARWWADLAAPEERAAYAVACVNRFTPLERDQFLEFLKGQT
ncbi:MULTISPECIES: hypothetical protein [unclassified Roseovarius]|uniref:hypothetical protein n=1 Tax=unclassified Roseovarius TaxID=2614913 RepID=UPI0027402B38|nr:hypothetical protein [Roseovarius sp. MMSF_3350]